MKINKQIEKKISETFYALEQVEEVKVSSSFKQNVLQALQEEESEVINLGWFTPKLQLAAMIIVIMVNAVAIMHSFSSVEAESSISSFAQEYNLETTNLFIK